MRIGYGCRGMGNTQPGSLSSWLEALPFRRSSRDILYLDQLGSVGVESLDWVSEQGSFLSWQETIPATRRAPFERARCRGAWCQDREVMRLILMPRFE